MVQKSVEITVRHNPMAQIKKDINCEQKDTKYQQMDTNHVFYSMQKITIYDKEKIFCYDGFFKNPYKVCVHPKNKVECWLFFICV